MVATKDTWHKDRTAAGLPERDDDGNLYSPHASRASFITWLGQLPSVPEGLRQKLARHKSLTETTYTTRGKAEMSDAIAQLPEIWPDSDPETDGGRGDNGGGFNGVTPPNGDNLRRKPQKALARRGNVRYVLTSDDDTHPTNLHRQPDPSSSLSTVGSGADLGGPASHDVESGCGSETETPVSGSDLIERVITDLLATQKILRSWLVGALPLQGSLRHGDNHDDDGRGKR